MANFFEIDDIAEVKRLNDLLRKSVSRILPHRESRLVGYPSNHFTAQVAFESNLPGGNRLWWSNFDLGHSKGTNKKSFVNLVGHAIPGETSTLNIDIQFNFPDEKYDRQKGGLFVKDATGTIFLAHRGNVTRGHAKLSRQQVMDEADLTIVQVNGQKGEFPAFLVAELDSDDLIQKISFFALEMRRAANAIAAGLPSEDTKSSAKQPTTQLNDLKDYFDEFSGEKQVPSRGTVFSECYHGRVVAALRKQLQTSMDLKKNREIDLVAFGGKDIFVFEVKTSADTQSIYTGLGQLLVHGRFLSEMYKNKDVHRILVLPNEPAGYLANVFDLGLVIDVEIITYKIGKDKKVSFTGWINSLKN